MYTSPVSQRPQRTTAGQTSKYSDYSVVSFPQLKKHSIVKTSLINIDPLSPLGAQSGNIKAYGERKKLMIVKTGTRLEMEEVSSRFSKESGSEEIIIHEYDCESPLAHGTRHRTFDDCTDEDEDDEEYTTTTHIKQRKSAREFSTIEQMSTNKAKVTTMTNLSTSGFDEDDDDQAFRRIYSCSTPSSAVKANKRKKEVNATHISDSSDTEQEETGTRWSKNKENLMNVNADFANLHNKKSKKKKQRVQPVVIQSSNVDYKSLCDEIDLLKKRTAKLEKVYSVIRRNTGFDQTNKPSTPASQGGVAQDVLTKVQQIFGVDPIILRAPINRPTKIMRELYKNSGFDLFKWKEYLEPNESILKDFIQQKCLVLPEDIAHVWSTIENSMAQMPYDAVKYKAKSNSAIQSILSATANDDLLFIDDVVQKEETVD